MRLPLFFASIILALAGASLLGAGLLNLYVGRDWLVAAAAGVALLIVSRAVRWRASKLPLAHALPPALPAERAPSDRKRR